MSGASWTPGFWADLAAVGQVCRRGGDDEKLKRATAYVENLASQHDGDKEMRREVEEAARKALGPLGVLALCSLKGVSRPSDVLMAAVHALVLASQEDLRVDLSPIGTANDDEGESDEEDGERDNLDQEDDSAGTPKTWSAEASWPEIFPDGWLVQKPRAYSFRYSMSSADAARQSKLEGKTIVLKGVVMSASSLLLSAMLEGGADADPVSAALTVGDFVAGTGRSSVEAALANRRSGLCGLITGASARQLGDVVRSQLLRPLLSKLFPDEDAFVSTGSGGAEGEDGASRASSRTSRTNFRDPLQVQDPRRSGFGMRGGRPLGPPGAMGGPGGFGDDLLPGGGLGQGGMLFGPGNAAFDGRFGPGGGFGGPGPDFDNDDDDRFLPGVPPGARFDPFGPPGIGGTPGRGGGGVPGPFGPGGSRGSRSSRGSHGSGGHGGRTSFPGEPDPDHLRPPFGSDDMFS